MGAITYELWMLFAALGVTAFSIFVQGMHLGATVGNAYVVSDRSEPAPFDGPMGSRLARNMRNQIEGMALFVPLVMIAFLSGISNGWTQTAALIFVCARLAYVPLYAFGIKGLRSLAWIVGSFSLLGFAWGLYSAA